MRHPSTGPLTPEQLKQLATDAPYGKALEAIRKHDPLYGRAPGEKFKWQVELSCRAYGYATVMAADEEEALAAAAALEDGKIEMRDYGEWTAESAVPE